MIRCWILLFMTGMTGLSLHHLVFPFSRLLSAGEPDSPALLSGEMKLEGNSFSVPLKQTDDGGSPLLHYNIRYRQVRDSFSLLSFQGPLFPDFHPPSPLLSLTSTQKGLSGKRCSYHPMPTPSPLKTCPSGQTIYWKLQQSMLMVPPSLLCSTSALQSSFVRGLLLPPPHAL